MAVPFAREGADIAIVYLDEHDDAEATQGAVKKDSRDCNFTWRNFEELTGEHFDRTMKTNLYCHFHMAQEAVLVLRTKTRRTSANTAARR